MNAFWIRTKQGFTVAGVILLITFALVPQAQSDLVYDEDAAENPPAAVEREAQRQQVVQSAELRPAAPVQVQAPVVVAPQAQQQTYTRTTVYPTAAPVVAAAPVEAFAAPAEAQQPTSRSELLRRKRVREELKNEDALQARIEELRLRDEQNRADKILGNPAMESVIPAAAPPIALAPAAPMQEQQIVVSQAPVAPHQDQIVIAQAAPAEAADVIVAKDEERKSDRTAFFVSPKAGVSNISGAGGYDVSGRYSLGISAGAVASDNLSFDFGYAYSVYGVKINSGNPFIQSMQYYNGGSYYQQDQRTALTLKQNLFELGLKLHVLGARSKFRPFLSGGGAYAKSYINYDERVLRSMKQYGYPTSQDYDLSQYLGTAGGGFDVRITDAISLGAAFKYYMVLSSQENGGINNLAASGYYPYGNGFNPNDYYNSLSDTDKQYVSGSLSRAGFYSILANLTFTF